MSQFCFEQTVEPSYSCPTRSPSTLAERENAHLRATCDYMRDWMTLVLDAFGEVIHSSAVGFGDARTGGDMLPRLLLPRELDNLNKLDDDELDMESLQGNYKSVARAYAIHNRLLNMKAKLKFYKDSDTSTINRKLLHELEECKMLMKGIEKDSAEREKKLVEAQDFAKKYRVLYLVERTEASAARRQLKKVEARVGEATSALAESMRYESMWRKR